MPILGLDYQIDVMVTNAVWIKNNKQASDLDAGIEPPMTYAQQALWCSNGTAEKSLHIVDVGQNSTRML